MNAKNQQLTKDPKDEFVKELISTARKNGLTHLKGYPGTGTAGNTHNQARAATIRNTSTH